MRRCLLLLAVVTPAFGEEAVFEKGAKAEPVARGGAGGEGPAWHPALGVLSSGNGHIYRLDLSGKSSIYRKDAGTNGLLFDRAGRLVACESAARRVTRSEPHGKVTVLADRFDGKRFNTPNDWGKGRGPDGLKQDTNGRLYVAAGRNKPNAAEPATDLKGGIYVLSPEGKLLDFLPVPTDEVTNCAFGDDRKTLYITAGGVLYRVRTTTPGHVVWPAPDAK